MAEMATNMTKLAKVMGPTYGHCPAKDESLVNERGQLDRSRLVACGVATLESVKSEAISGKVAITGLGMAAELSGSQLKQLPSYGTADVAEAVAAENPEASIRGAIVSLSALKHSRTGTGKAIADFVAKVSGELDDETHSRIRFAALHEIFGPRLSKKVEELAEQLEAEEKAAKQQSIANGQTIEGIAADDDEDADGETEPNDAELEAMTAPQS
jgi:hypothetical protein